MDRYECVDHDEQFDDVSETIFGKHCTCWVRRWCMYHETYEDVDRYLTHCQHCGGPNH